MVLGVLGNVASPTGGSIRLHCGRNSRPLPLIMDIGPMVTLIIIVKLIIMRAMTRVYSDLLLVVNYIYGTIYGQPKYLPFFKLRAEFTTLIF